MATDLAKVAKDKGIKYFLISYVDLFGALRAKLVPAQAIGQMVRDGAGFAGFATWLDMTPADPDMFGKTRHRPASSSCPGSRRSAGSPPISGWTARKSSRRRAWC